MGHRVRGQRSEGSLGIDQRHKAQGDLGCEMWDVE